MLTLAGGAALLCIVSNHFAFGLFMNIGCVRHYCGWLKPVTNDVSITFFYMGRNLFVDI